MKRNRLLVKFILSVSLLASLSACGKGTQPSATQRSGDDTSTSENNTENNNETNTDTGTGATDTTKGFQSDGSIRIVTP